MAQQSASKSDAVMILVAVLLQLMALSVAGKFFLDVGETGSSSPFWWFFLIAILSAGSTGVFLVRLLRKHPDKAEPSITEPPPLVHDDRIATSLVGTLTMGTRSAKSYLDNMPIGLLTFDRDGRLTAANLTALKMLECTVDTLIGRSIATFFKLPARHYTADLESLREAALNQITEAALQRSGGNSRGSLPVDISMAEFSGPSGVGLIVNMLDITDRYEVEKLKEDFLAIVSHDLRTPLSSLALFLSELESSQSSEPLTAEQRASIIRMESEVQRLIRLVTTLLDMAKIRSGKLVLSKKSFDVGPLLQRVATQLRDSAEKKSLQIAVKSVDDFVVADEDRVYQVLENLIGNAIKFAPPQSTITVEAKHASSAMLFEVHDTGAGVPEEKREKIFERFEQIDGADATTRGGAGLGLAICKLIVEQHGGSIGVDGEQGKGCRFWFVLPD